MKKCKKCKCEKEESEFYNHKNTKDGLQPSCKKCCKDYQKEYQAKSEKYKKYHKEYHKKYLLSSKYKDRVREKIKFQRKFRYDNDAIFKLRQLLRARLRCAINNNWKSGLAIKNLGCSIKELKEYLEKKFVDGMNWDNHGKIGNGKVWNIDHIIPLTKFDLSDSVQISKACNYTNLQPLWADENISKGNN
jgi:hypothetical protein